MTLVASSDGASVDVRRKVYKRLAASYTDTYGGRFSTGMLRQIDELGQPFVFEFADVRSGAKVSNEQMRGKVVVIDFWSTTCGPCTAELPHLKQTYAKYRERGAELIGVSLDAPATEGGRDALLEFLRKQEIPWPQWYQGGGFESQFSKSWGIGGIPALFVIDKQARLRSTTARGQLEPLLDELLRE